MSMSKSLKTIQTLSKIGKILSKIVFICCIIGFCGCIAGIASLAVGAGSVLRIGGVNIHGLIENASGLSVGTLYASMVFGMIMTAAEAVVAKFAEVYFKHELAAGTPFTFAGAKEMLRLGILTIAVPVGAMLIGGIVYGVMMCFVEGVQELDANDSISLGLGIMFIVLSVICKYGAELREGTAAGATEEITE